MWRSPFPNYYKNLLSRCYMGLVYLISFWGAPKNESDDTGFAIEKCERPGDDKFLLQVAQDREESASETTAYGCSRTPDTMRNCRNRQDSLCAIRHSDEIKSGMTYWNDCFRMSKTRSLIRERRSSHCALSHSQANEAKLSSFFAGGSSSSSSP